MVLYGQDIIIIWLRLNNNWKNLKISTSKSEHKKKKEIVYNNAKRLNKILLSIYINSYNNILDEEKEILSEKYDPSNLLIKDHKFI